jgi:hypothetical protein
MSGWLYTRAAQCSLGLAACWSVCIDVSSTVPICQEGQRGDTSTGCLEEAVLLLPL